LNKPAHDAPSRRTRWRTVHSRPCCSTWSSSEPWSACSSTRPRPALPERGPSRLGLDARSAGPAPTKNREAVGVPRAGWQGALPSRHYSPATRPARTIVWPHAAACHPAAGRVQSGEQLGRPEPSNKAAARPRGPAELAELVIERG
jgi:hypothetical protein